MRSTSPRSMPLAIYLRLQRKPSTCEKLRVESLGRQVLLFFRMRHGLALLAIKTFYDRFGLCSGASETYPFTSNELHLTVLAALDADCNQPTQAGWFGSHTSNIETGFLPLMPYTLASLHGRLDSSTWLRISPDHTFVDIILPEPVSAIFPRRSGRIS